MSCKCNRYELRDDNFVWCLLCGKNLTLHPWDERIVGTIVELMRVKASDEAVPPAGDRRDGPPESDA